MELVGNTPLLELSRFSAEYGLERPLVAKVEYLNPAGSVKDRVALEMIEEGERSGKLVKGSVIIEPTSGNTGIGLAAVAAAKGYRVIIVMPDTMSAERRMLIAAYGAELVLTDGSLGMSGAISKADELAREIPGAIVAGQFTNPANPAAHEKTTGPEIWRDTDGEVDTFVCGVGTGGTVTGTGRYLKKMKPSLRVIGAEPAGSPVLTGGCAGPHGLQGIGAGFVPETLDVSVMDEVITVTEEEAYAAARVLARTEGILVGISAGAALSAAVKAAEGLTVVLLPDTGDRYLSTDLFVK